MLSEMHTAELLLSNAPNFEYRAPNACLVVYQETPYEQLKVGDNVARPTCDKGGAIDVVTATVGTMGLSGL
jgi:hypothetical protein